MSAVEHAMYSELARFLFQEAQLLDEGEYSQWLTLWSPQGRYWMPCDHSDRDPQCSSSLINDDLPALALRVARLTQPNAHSMSPVPIGCRIISNLMVESSSPLIVRSKLLCHEFQRRETARDDYRVFCATVRHQLVPNAQSWLIQLKHILLIDSSGARTMMPVPL